MCAFIKSLVVIIALVLSGCAPIQTNQAKDEAYAKLMVGTWENDKKKTNYSRRFVKTYLPDGTAYGSYTEGYWADSGAYHEKYKFSFRSKWKVQKSIVVIWGVESLPAGVSENGEVIRDRIIYINDMEAKFVSEESGEEFYRYRVKP